MKLDMNTQPLMKKRKEGRPKRKEETPFEKKCRLAGQKPDTVRSRMRPRSQRGQGMTLEEALAVPVANRTEVGQRGRAKSHWYRDGIEDPTQPYGDD